MMEEEEADLTLNDLKGMMCNVLASGTYKQKELLLWFKFDDGIQLISGSSPHYTVIVKTSKSPFRQEVHHTADLAEAIRFFNSLRPKKKAKTKGPCSCGVCQECNWATRHEL